MHVCCMCACTCSYMCVLATENSKILPYTVPGNIMKFQGNLHTMNRKCKLSCMHFMGFPGPGNLRFLPVADPSQFLQ